MQPDVQARAEVSAHLNQRPVLHNDCTELGLRLELEAKEREAAEWEALYVIAVQQVQALRESERMLEQAIDYELEKSDFLAAALQHYASHAWNDIKYELEAKGWL